MLNKSLIFSFQTKDVLSIHQSKCPNYNTKVVVSVDGVSECKSNINSMDVYSARFSNCRVVYPIQIVKPIGKFKMDQHHYLDQFLTDICSNDCEIEAFVGDKPKRSDARDCKCHASYFPCEYCESKGLLLKTQDNSITLKKKQLNEHKDIISQQLALAEENNDEAQVIFMKKLLKGVNEAIKNINNESNNIVWSASSQNGPKRTIEGVMIIVEKIENNEPLSQDEAKGIKGRSLLLEIPYFNFILDIPVEYLHGVCLGVVKRMIILTFHVGKIRERNTKRKLSSPNDYNNLICQVKFHRESSRRARNLDCSMMKGQEYRNIIILFFPLVIDCIEVDAKERRLWLLLAYMIRLCVLPNEEYDTVDKSILTYCGKHFYDLYEKLVHALNCSYYTHVIGSHMPDIRHHGPLTLMSAFGFESFYVELRNSFCPGTPSTAKQIMQQIMLKRSISHHCCESSIYFSPKDSNMESNSYVYTFIESQYQFYKIKTIENDIMECCKVGKYPTFFPETPTLKWEKIGVFQAG